MLGDDKQKKIFLNLFEKGTKLVYQKGEYIIHPSESPNQIFYIQEGLVKAYNISKYGEENLLIIRKPKEIFPLIWAITGEGRHIAYQALTTSKILRISRKDFIEFLHNNSSALYPFIDLIIGQYKIHSERILNLQYRSVRERLASFLLTMSKRFGKNINDKILINVQLKQQDIASSISATRETTSREMNILERKGIISTSQHKIIINDKDKLKNLL